MKRALMNKIHLIGTLNPVIIEDDGLRNLIK